MRSRGRARKRPLPSRSCCTMPAASKSLPAASGCANGTIAIGTGSRTPEVISIWSSARAGGFAPRRPPTIAAVQRTRRRRRKSRAFMSIMASVRLEVDAQVAIEQCRIGWGWKRRGAIDRRLDRFAHRLVAVAFTNAHFSHFASGYLRHIQHAFYAGPRRGRTQPRAVDPGGDLRLPAGERRACARFACLLLGGEASLQILLALRLLLRLRLPLLLLGGALLRLGLLARLALGRRASRRFGGSRLGCGLFGCGLLGAPLLFGNRLLLRALLLALCELLRCRLWRSYRLRRRLHWRRRLRGGQLRTAHAARIDHPRLDGERRCGARRPAKQHPAVNQRAEQRRMEQHRQRDRHPTITHPLHARKRISSRA